jgi:hypothetical protein
MWDVESGSKGLRRGWVEEFMQRFPKLSLRKPQPLTFAPCTDEVIKGFFDKLGGI